MKVIEDTNRYGDLIKKVFPNAIVDIKRSFSDYTWGWNIVPAFGRLIQFEVFINDPMKIRIAMREVGMAYASDTKTIFHGIVPENSIGDLDLRFVEQMLRNYQCFLY